MDTKGIGIYSLISLRRKITIQISITHILFVFSFVNLISLKCHYFYLLLIVIILPFVCYEILYLKEKAGFFASIKQLFQSPLLNECERNALACAKNSLSPLSRLLTTSMLITHTLNSEQFCFFFHFSFFLRRISLFKNTFSKNRRWMYRIHSFSLTHTTGVVLLSTTLYCTSFRLSANNFPRIIPVIRISACEGRGRGSSRL